MDGLTKVYGLMAAAVCAYLAVDRGMWQVLPVAAALGALTVVGGRLLWRSMRGSRRGSRWPLFATFTTWLLLTTIAVVAGVFLVALDKGGI